VQGFKKSAWALTVVAARARMAEVILTILDGGSSLKWTECDVG
jgi:hypothetical protein